MVNMYRARLRYFGVTLLLVTVLALPQLTHAEESTSVRQRRSGISDQRLAELETLYALSSMRGKGGSHPVAYGLIDPARIGKRSFYSSKADEDNRKYSINFMLQVLRRLKTLPDISATSNQNTVNLDQ